jgi:hypothetical protein
MTGYHLIIEFLKFIFYEFNERILKKINLKGKIIDLIKKCVTKFYEILKRFKTNFQNLFKN